MKLEKPKPDTSVIVTARYTLGGVGSKSITIHDTTPEDVIQAMVELVESKEDEERVGPSQP